MDTPVEERHVYDVGMDRDELHRNGVIAIVEVDELGNPVVKVSHPPGTYLKVFHNDELIVDLSPTEEEVAIIIAEQEEAEAKKTKTDRIKEVLESMPETATVDEVAAAIIVVTGEKEKP